MNEDKRHHHLEITKLPLGGFVVSEGFRHQGYMAPPFIFAASTIEEALKFIKRHIEQ